MHSKLLRVFAVLEVYSRCLLLFLTSEARAEEKKISSLNDAVLPTPCTLPFLAFLFPD